MGWKGTEEEWCGERRGVIFGAMRGGGQQGGEGRWWRCRGSLTGQLLREKRERGLASDSDVFRSDLGGLGRVGERCIGVAVGRTFSRRSTRVLEIATRAAQSTASKMPPVARPALPRSLASDRGPV